jgi:hypothetical protein
VKPGSLVYIEGCLTAEGVQSARVGRVVSTTIGTVTVKPYAVTTENGWIVVERKFDPAVTLLRSRVKPVEDNGSLHEPIKVEG